MKFREGDSKSLCAERGNHQFGKKSVGSMLDNRPTMIYNVFKQGKCSDVIYQQKRFLQNTGQYFICLLSSADV